MPKKSPKPPGPIPVAIPSAVEMVGKTFGRLVVLKFSHSTKDYRRYWECKCACGQVCLVDGAYLRQSRTRSCGCLRRETERTCRVTHGQSRTALYGIWRTMISRCNNPNAVGYKKYGAVGISVCDRWAKSFEDFLSDMGPRPSPKHSLDRYPNQGGNYEPGNVRWATSSEQARNSKNAKILVYQGETRCLLEWCEKLQLPYETVKRRLQMGWSVADAFTKPLKNGSPVCRK